MALFPVPDVKKFFDDRLIISWKINQPQEHFDLENLIIQISGNPPLNFDPLQDSKIVIPKLDGSNLIVNWVFRKPTMNTEILLELKSFQIYEKYLLNISPDTDFKPEYHE